ncbi:MAG: BON domain-containing protein [Armatimonadota bacterium]|nr:BON domain-containing protein [Armatimonadota bacterium]
MNASDDQSQNDGGVLDEAPVVVFPSPNGQGIGGQPTGFPSGVAVAPSPNVGASEGAADAGVNLSSRIEQTLAEDGRFSAFASQLVITTDNDGTIHLAGSVPSDERRQHLIATLRTLPGVTDVQSSLTVG